MEQRIIKKIDEIADILKTQAASNSRGGLLGGVEGEILFLNYYANYKKSNSHNEIAFTALNNIFEQINNGEIQNLVYSSGIAGTAWLVNHLAVNDFIDIESDELLTEFDTLFEELMLHHIKEGEYDYLHKGLGLTFYYTERNSEQCNQLVSKAIKELDKIKIITSSGAYKWLSKRNNFDGTFTDEFNISLSHGMSSIAAILAKALKKNIEPELSKDLLLGTIKYILEQECDFETNGSSFPSTSKETLESNEYYSRLAWCYGDLGVASALYQCAKALQDKNLEEKAVSILLKNTERRDIAKNVVYDAGLCHGSAGIAHIFNRMYLNTSIEKFREAADYWFEMALEMANFPDGLAGYKSRHYWQNKESWENTYGFLEGIAGIGLAMIARVSDTPPNWDSSLLLS